MYRTISAEQCESFNEAPKKTKVKKRLSAERFVIELGLGLNALVIGIIIYATL